MIGMPVKSAKPESAISPVFGKVKYFAIVDDNGNIEFVENVEKSGVKAIELLLSKGVKTLLLSHLGKRPYEVALENNMKIYYVGKERITIKEAVEKLKNGEYPELATLDLEEFFNSHHHHHDHDHGHHHH